MKQYTLHIPENYQKRKLTDTSKWVKALRSGRYKQGNGNLCEITGEGRKYCCLGVRLQIQKFLTIHRRTTSYGGNTANGIDKRVTSKDSVLYGMLEESNPDFPILRRLGRLPENVYFTIGDRMMGKYTTLADANDSGLSFKQIADIIEQVYED